jgi:diguanylate cyclase (GGDEF)-like protein
VLVVAVYTFVIALELWRERRKSLYSRTAAIVVPSLHAAIFLMPLAMRAMQPEGSTGGWLTLFALETIIYAVGAAFIVMLMVKDQNVHVYRSVANTDHLTGLLNRRAFMERARQLGTQQGERGEPLTLMMFDLDHFKLINDRFGHAMGDEVLRVFARVASGNMRANDIIGRLGGEEFAAIVPEPMEFASRIAERLRIGFEAAGVTVGKHAVGATVSIGAATSYEPVTDIDALIIRADAALYSAKRAGRNRLHTADDEQASDQRARLIDAARHAPPVTSGWLPRRKSAARQAEPVGSEASG